MRLQANGLDFNLEVRGSGSPLLLLHGFTGSLESWRPLLDAIGQGRRTIALDIIGHGQSTAPSHAGRYDMDHAVADIAALLDQVEAPTIDLVGYSMGARLALYFATQMPARVRLLLLESGSPGLASQVERQARVEADERQAGMIENEGLPAFIDYWERIPLFATQATLPPIVRAAVRDQRLRSQPQGLANSLRGMGTGNQPSLWDALPGLTVPVLLLAGELDAKYRDIATQMASLLPNSRVVIVQGAGHTVHLEQPQAFQDAALEFLTSQAATGVTV